MKVTPLGNINNISSKTLNKAKNISKQIPRKITVNNLPAVATAIGLLSPIPFGCVIFGAIGKIVQIAIKKCCHKP